MNRNVCGILWLTAITLAHAQQPPSPAYPAMAPIEQYRLATRDEEVALARSAAPPSIAEAAEVLVLGERDYETAIKGSNGFVCVVQRAWAVGFDDPEFWNPKIRSPNCFNAPAARSVLQNYLQRTRWVLAGEAKTNMVARTRAAVQAQTWRAPELGAMCYMMSKQGYLNDRGGHWMPHVMLYGLRMPAAALGANAPGSPVLAAEGDALDPVTTFFIPVRRWSDGTPAPEHHD